MEWDFTTKQVIGGEVNYSIEDFQRDLKNEVEFNFTSIPKKTKEAVSKKTEKGITLNDYFNFLYGICYLSAIEKKPSEISTVMGRLPTPERNKIIEYMRESQKENIDMLRAILMRQYLRLKEGGLSDGNILKLYNSYLSEDNKGFLNWAWGNFHDKK